jgi:sugar phosphate isomerase/epimerase
LTNFTVLQPWMQAVPIDEGIIDYPAFLGALCEGGFCGTVAYEMCSPLRDGGDIETLDSHARRFVEFLAEVREQAHVAIPGGDCNTARRASSPKRFQGRA